MYRDVSSRQLIAMVAVAAFVGVAVLVPDGARHWLAVAVAVLNGLSLVRWWRQRGEQERR
jgi:formate dehydrogenase assembly factor FdhD